MSHKSELEQEISLMQEVVDSDASEDIKKSIRPSLAKAKSLLTEMNKKPAAASVKEPVSVKTASHKAKNILSGIKKSESKDKNHKKSASPAERKVKSLLQHIRSIPALKKVYDHKGVNLKKDADLKAKKPGDRISATGNHYFEDRPNRSDISPKKFPYLEKGGPLKQTDPQGENYNYRRDQDQIAKHVGWRYTDAGASRLGVSPYAKPTQRHIDKYADKTFIKKGEPHKYLYEETRKDKSDKVPFKKFEDGGDISDNLNIFGYQTKYFHMCPTAVDEFEQAMDSIERDYSDNDTYYESMKSALTDLAKLVDHVLGIEYEVSVEGLDGVEYLMHVTETLTYIGMFNYKAGLLVNLDFLGNHVVNIAKHIDYSFVADEIPTEIVVVAPEEVNQEIAEPGGGDNNETPAKPEYELGGTMGDIVGDPLNDFRFDIHSPNFKKGGMINPNKKDEIKGSVRSKNILNKHKKKA